MTTQRCGMTAIGLGLFLILTLASITRGQNWPRFRGPNGQGLSDAKTIPTQWSQDDYNWKVTLPGTGHASPVVWGDKVFVTCVEESPERGVLLCLNAADGSERWRRVQELSEFRINRLNSLASATPAVDAERVYVLWPGADETPLMGLTHEGQAVWTASLDGVRARHGHGSSPIVHDGRVFVSHEKEGSDKNIRSQWLALESDTGHVAWRREEGAVENVSYSTPCVYSDERGREQIVFASNAHGVTGVDPATGDVVWEVSGVLPARVVGSPLVAGAMVFATCGEGGGGVRLTAVKPSFNGQTYSATEIYSLKGRTVPYAPTLVASGDLLFGFHDRGVVSCFQRDSGEVLWSEKPAGRFYGSPVCVDGVLYAITTDGEVVVIKAESTYTLVAVNPLGQGSQATPAVAGGRMFLRTESQLICIGGKERYR